jgi:ankyrin repeat protein
VKPFIFICLYYLYSSILFIYYSGLCISKLRSINLNLRKKVTAVMSLSQYSIGIKVWTHSLSVAEYSDVFGKVIGAVTVDKNGVPRVPVSLQLNDGNKKTMLLQLHNLLIVHDSSTLNMLTNELFTAAKNGDITAVRKCVKGGADVNVYNANGRTPIMFAAEEGHVDAINVLVELGAGVNTPDNDGSTPIIIAAQDGHVDVIRLLVDHGADINTPDAKNDLTAIMYAIICNHVDVIRVLFELGADIKSIYKTFGTPLHLATSLGRVDAIRLLIEFGADVNNLDDNGSTPISIAVLEDQLDAIRLLLELGADINTPDKYGMTPIMHSPKMWNMDVVTLLIEHGADINKPNNDGVTLVIFAANDGNTGLIKALYKLGADMKPDWQCSITEIAQDRKNTKALQLIDKILAKLTKECEFCSSSRKRLKVCGKCEKVRYCSRECQLQDYKKHKKECKSSSVSIDA